VQTSGFRNVTNHVDRGSTDGFLVGLKQLEQLKSDMHPLTGSSGIRSGIQREPNVTSLLASLLRSAK
jgi:hypothetical protein